MDARARQNVQDVADLPQATRLLEDVFENTGDRQVRFEDQEEIRPRYAPLIALVGWKSAEIRGR